MRWLLVSLAVLAVATVAGVTYAVARSQPSNGIEHPPAPSTRYDAAAVWRAGVRPAPAFALKDQHGRPLTLTGLRGRPVVVTFIDPVCRNLCPLEAKILMKAIATLPAAQRPVVVAVSVNPPADTAANFAQDESHWHLDSDWLWGVGTEAQLAPIWHRYEIAVQTIKEKIEGVRVNEVVHTEASYVIDASGHERGLFLYPFTAAHVAALLRDVSTT